MLSFQDDKFRNVLTWFLHLPRTVNSVWILRKWKKTILTHSNFGSSEKYS